MVFAIPSYKRSKTQKTLNYLKSLGINKNDIYIFVQTESDYKEYSALHSNSCDIIYKHATSIPTARNNILDHFAGKQDVIMMDDDISVISIGAKGRKFTDVNSSRRLTEILSRMYSFTKHLKGSIFGLYPVYNEFFMSDSISTQVTVNTILGFPKEFPYRFDESFIAKEDIELCGRILSKGGNVVRFNNVAFKAEHRTNAGGVHDIWASDANIIKSRELCLMYPAVFALQKNKPQEVRVILKDKKLKAPKWEGANNGK